MADVATLTGFVAAAEAGESRYPDMTRPGLAGVAENLARAEQLLFAEAPEFDAHFEKLTTVPAASVLAARATRLRLLRKHRAAIKLALVNENPFSGRLFAALAAGPGPTFAKRLFAESLTDRNHVNSVVALRRSLAGGVYPVYVAERAWLKKVGPSGSTTRWERFREHVADARANALGDLPAIIAILATMVACGVVFGLLRGALAGSGIAVVPVPIGAIGYLFYRMLRRSGDA